MIRCPRCARSLGFAYRYLHPACAVRRIDIFISAHRQGWR
jgi:hypothetical protein